MCRRCHMYNTNERLSNFDLEARLEGHLQRCILADCGFLF